ncbi:hypothetical protein [Micromonospora sp. U21]|uniref:hypothetical protein n=1 Tax=Micromonospora sp. U21 TaxID=2824899 RepID=UPI001B36F8FC|nr:hypothetical protein [Micromonospora sp. U21]MBQ0905600.1 hypothetical protein [Micromonospora sp. U21]
MIKALGDLWVNVDGFQRRELQQIAEVLTVDVPVEVDHHRVPAVVLWLDGDPADARCSPWTVGPRTCSIAAGFGHSALGGKPLISCVIKGSLQLTSAQGRPSPGTHACH